MKKVLIVDTFAFLYRAFYASENMMKNTTGNNVGALSGFFSTVLYLLKQTSCTHVVFVSDSSHPSKRKLAYPEYKANRDKIPDDLRLQVQMVANAFEKGGIAVQKMDLLEADDIIVYLAEEFSKDGFDVVIASGDKDILQVVSDEKHIS
ncbi:MAG: DNA polymerase I, partial [Sphaerochaetaceae bacterium]|nr:DNA polymerase I [Sphaerochaetaceae bacterium]